MYEFVDISIGKGYYCDFGIHLRVQSKNTKVFPVLTTFQSYFINTKSKPPTFYAHL